MPEFADSHRTVIGYHGTSRSVAEQIVLGQSPIRAHDQSHDWMGSGVYYWQHAPKQAWRFAEIRRRQRRWDEPVAVVASMIRLGNCFDLLDPDNARLLETCHDLYIESCTTTGRPVPRNQRRWKYFDRAVFEFAYEQIDEESLRLNRSSRVDTCRGVSVPSGTSGRSWPGSWVQQGALIQLLIRNIDCILGSWLVPLTEEVASE